MQDAYGEWGLVRECGVQGVSDGHIDGDLVEIVLKDNETAHIC